MVEFEQRLAYGVEEFCKFADVGRTTAYREISEGRLKARKVGRRTIILKDDAENFLRSLAPACPRGSVTEVA